MNLEYLRRQIIGGQVSFKTPYGEKLMTYADYTASGKSLKFIEDYMMRVEISYANTHTEDGYAGSQTTKLYEDAKNMIRKAVNADESYIVMNAGSGTTGVVLKLAQILGVYQAPASKDLQDEQMKVLGERSKQMSECLNDLEEYNQKTRPIIFISPYEHHSNDLIWRESNAKVIEIPLNEKGKIDLNILEEQVSLPKYKNRKKIGAFSAASNVSGILSPVEEIARIMHKHGGWVFFDYAACAPYVKIDMMVSKDSYYDGIYLSPHKFLGGPGTSGLLLIHEKIYNNTLAPTCAGGGTVEYVSSKGYDFVESVERREDAGTPPILQMIRTALAMDVKERVGHEQIELIENKYIHGAIKRLSKSPNIHIMGPVGLKHRLGILSFNIGHDKEYLHPRFVTKLLNDLFGIQTRAGCSCAGPYGHRLLGISPEESEAYREIFKLGDESMKPGWARLNFHYTLKEATYEFIIEAIEFIAKYGYLFLQVYTVNPKTGLWTHDQAVSQSPLELNVDLAMKLGQITVCFDEDAEMKFYKKVLKEANNHKEILEHKGGKIRLHGNDILPELAWYYERE